MPNIQAKVALDKQEHPERYCPARRCLWRTQKRGQTTAGDYCPRHQDYESGKHRIAIDNAPFTLKEGR